MVLAGVVPELAYYGLLGAFFTHTIGFPFTLLALLWFYNTVIAVHRNDPFAPADLVIALNFTTPSIFPLGVALGLLYAWLLRTAPLLRWELWRVRRRPDTDGLFADIVFYYQGTVTLIALAAALAAVGVNFLRDKFEPEVSSGASTAIGVAALVLGVGAALLLLARLALSNVPGDRLDFGFTVALALYMILPATYDYLVRYRPLQILAFQVALALVTLLVTATHVAYARRLGAQPETLLALRSDPRVAPSQLSMRSIVLRWFTLWLLSAIIYFVGGIADDSTALFDEGKQMKIGDVESVAIVVLFTTLVLIAFGALIGICIWRTPEQEAAEQWQWDSVGGDLADTPIALDEDYVIRAGARQRLVPAVSAVSSSSAMRVKAEQFKVK